MNTIYDIYEDMNFSILGSTKSKVKNISKNINDLMNTYKERFIKIVSLSAEMTEKQEELFREMVEDAIAVKNAKYIDCQLPKDIQLYLINASKNQLKPADFKGFPNSKKEWEFRTSMWKLHFITKDERLNLSFLSKIKENEIQNYTYDVLRCGKTIIIRGNEVVCVWIDGLHKICGNFTNNPLQSCRPLE